MVSCGDGWVPAASCHDFFHGSAFRLRPAPVAGRTQPGIAGTGSGRILPQEWQRDARGLGHGFCVVQLTGIGELALHLRGQLSTTLIACSPRAQPSLFAGSILAIGMR